MLMYTLRENNSTQFGYQGTELDAFAEASNWKRYWSNKVRPFTGESVVEVGAGIGSSTGYLCGNSRSSWLCLDPDPAHASHLKALVSAGALPAVCNVVCGVLDDLATNLRVDTILYIDVLEHIENDEAEIRCASAHLLHGGHLVVLAPAFNTIYSEFDRAVGHFRRYTKPDASRLTVDGLTIERIFYLDCVGFVAALANRMFMKTATPSKAQVLFWDRVLVPVSTLADKVFGPLFGKTIVMVWKKS
jgi:hypothetical protein